MKYIVAFTCLFSVIMAKAQGNSGFYGRTVFIEANSAVSFPLLNRLENFGSSDNKDKIATALNVVLGKAVGPKLALSLETGIFFGDFNPTSSDSYYNNYYYYDGYYGDANGNVSAKYKISRIDRLSFRSFSIMPKFEIAGRGGNSPGGLSHQIGIGYSSSKIVDKDYKYSLYNSTDTLNPKTDIADYNAKYKGFIMMYAVNVRVPITKTLLFNYGLRTTLNLARTNFYNSSDLRYVTSDEASDLIKRSRFRTVFNLQIGFTYLL